MKKLNALALSATLLGATLFSSDAAAFCVHNNTGGQIHVLFSTNPNSMIKHLKSHKGALIFADAVGVVKKIGMGAINAQADADAGVTKKTAATDATKKALQEAAKEKGISTAKTALSLGVISDLPERGDLVYIQHGGLGSVVTALDRSVNKIQWNKTIKAGQTGKTAECWNGADLAKELKINENSKLTFLITEKLGDGKESFVLVSGSNFGTHAGIVVNSLPK